MVVLSVTGRGLLLLEEEVVTTGGGEAVVEALAGEGVVTEAIEVGTVVVTTVQLAFVQVS